MKTIPDTWTVGQYSQEKSEGLVRLNTGLEEYIGNPKYPYRIGIAVPLEEFEVIDFYDFEDLIFDNFQNENKSIICAILTSSSFKELVIYTSEEHTLKVQLPLISQAFPTLKVTSYFEEDKSWRLYSDFLNAIKNEQP